MANLIGQQVKGYELQERIAAGGFGVVYRAFQSTIGREVAIKIILPGLASKPEFVRRFEAEAQLIARLEHPFIVPLHDYWRDPDGAYLVMRYLRGGSLHDFIKKHGKSDMEDAFNIFVQISEGLHIAHRNQIVHRDIKPANILLDEDGNAYLGDFGIAKDLTNSGSITEPDSFIGSPEYLAPEQARSEPVTAQTDIYSLGVVLYEMLSGQHPFPGIDNKIGYIFKHLEEPLPEIDSLDDRIQADVNDVIQKATSKDPQHRFADVIEMINALRQATQLNTALTSTSLVVLLTPREQEVMQLIIGGQTNREIADLLVLAEATIKSYIKSIYRKLNVRSRVQAIARARDLDFVIKKPEVVVATGYLSEPQNPYKGLGTFQSADAQSFFGREKLIQKLLNRLQEAVEYQRFLAVVGPSGSGKSSVVKAGLIPALWRGDLVGSDNWYIIDILPGTHPIDELEVALFHIATDKTMNLREQLERDTRGLIRAANMLLPDDGSELLIIIDQFEEVFTLLADEDERLHFLGLLREAVTDKYSRVRVIATLRADYYDRPLQYAGFGKLVRDRVETALPLSVEELERTISEPAKQQGVTFEDGLVSRIVSDVHYQPGSLPLLQYALTELFERRNGRVLTQEAYLEIGGAGGALANRADEVYLEQDDKGQKMIRQLFLRLVTLGEGAEDTRRRANRAELLDMTPNKELMSEVIDMYSASRLLSLDHDLATRHPTIEVSHEAILREWQRLRSWLNESRGEIRLQRQLVHMAGEWHYSQKDRSFLARGSRLEQFERWITKTDLALTRDEHAFLEESIADHQRQEQARVEHNNLVKDLTQRSVNRLQMLVGVFAVAAVIAIGLTMVAFDREARAQDNFTRAERIRLAAQAQIALDRGEDTVIPALLSLQSLQLGYSPEADTALVTALSRGFLRQIYSGHTDSTTGVVFSPSGNYIVTVNTDTTARLWNVQTGEEIHQFLGHTALVHDAVFSPDGQHVITVSSDGTARLWNIESGEEEQRIIDHDGPVWGLAISPDGKYIVTSDESGSAYLWNAENMQQVQTFVGHDDTINRISFSPDGHTIVTGSWDTTARLWDVVSGIELRRFEGHADCVCGVDISPDGRQILTASYDRTVRLWDIETAEEIHLFEGYSDLVLHAKFSPDGRLALTGSLDRIARLWDIETGVELRRVDGAGVPIAFSPDGRYVASGTVLGDTWLWDVEVDIEPRSLRFEGGVHTPTPILAVFSDDQTRLTVGMRAGAVVTYDLETMQALNTVRIPTDGLLNVMVVSPDGELIVASSSDGTARLFDAHTLEELRQFPGHQGSIYDISFSSDTLLMATVGIDATTRLWDVRSGELLHELTGHNGAIRTVIFSADDRTIMVAGDDASVYFWDVESGQLLRRLETEHNTTIFDVAISPNGRFMLIGYANNTADLWDIESGEAIHQLVGHRDPVRAVAFAPDGRTLLTASDDRTVRMWDIESGQTVRFFAGHDTAARMAMFTANGEHIFVGTFFRGYVWRTALGEVIQLVCSQLPRDFTEVEQTIYSIDNSTSNCEVAD